MKKIICALLLVLACFSTAFAGTVGQTSTAAYATIAPVIDGQIDEIWATTEKQVMGNIDTNLDITGGYTQILWDETGFYFLAVVDDFSLTTNDIQARNSVDFWVSEKNTMEKSYDTDPGDWHFCKSSDGHSGYYTGNTKVIEVAVSAVAISATGYVVELYVPYQADIAPKLGNVIGYSVSFNDDFNDDGQRDGYTFWSVAADSSDYWAHTLALPEITLVGAPAQP